MTPLRVLSGLCAAAAARGSRSSGGGGGAVAPWHRPPLAPPAAAPPQVGQASRGAAARAIAWSQHVWQQVGALLGCAIWGLEISSTSLAPCEGRGRPLAGGWLLLRCCIRCMLLLHAAAAGCRCCPPVQRRIRHENQVKLSRQGCMWASTRLATQHEMTSIQIKIGDAPNHRSRMI